MRPRRRPLAKASSLMGRPRRSGRVGKAEEESGREGDGERVRFSPGAGGAAFGGVVGLDGTAGAGGAGGEGRRGEWRGGCLGEGGISAGGGPVVANYSRGRGGDCCTGWVWGD